MSKSKLAIQFLYHKIRENDKDLYIKIQKDKIFANKVYQLCEFYDDLDLIIKLLKGKK